jgi:hypothetical protein
VPPEPRARHVPRRRRRRRDRLLPPQAQSVPTLGAECARRVIPALRDGSARPRRAEAGYPGRRPAPTRRHCRRIGQAAIQSGNFWPTRGEYASPHLELVPADWEFEFLPSRMFLRVLGYNPRSLLTTLLLDLHGFFCSAPASAQAPASLWPPPGTCSAEATNTSSASWPGCQVRVLSPTDHFITLLLTASIY